MISETSASCILRADWCSGYTPASIGHCAPSSTRCNTLPLCYYQQVFIHLLPEPSDTSPRSLPALDQVVLQLCSEHGSQPSRTIFNNATQDYVSAYEKQGKWVHACMGHECMYICMYMHTPICGSVCASVCVTAFVYEYVCSMYILLYIHVFIWIHLCTSKLCVRYMYLVDTQQIVLPPHTCITCSSVIFMEATGTCK